MDHLKKELRAKNILWPSFEIFARLETWAKPPLKSMVFTVIQKFVVL
jgi:hypothetical protein